MYLDEYGCRCIWMSVWMRMDQGWIQANTSHYSNSTFFAVTLIFQRHFPEMLPDDNKIIIFSLLFILPSPLLPQHFIYLSFLPSFLPSFPFPLFFPSFLYSFHLSIIPSILSLFLPSILLHNVIDTLPLVLPPAEYHLANPSPLPGLT